jgi:hypothetical protein
LAKALLNAEKRWSKMKKVHKDKEKKMKEVVVE